MTKHEFSLGRYFRLWSFVVLLTTGTIMGGLYHYVSIHQLVEQSERANVALTRSFANALWPEVRGYVKEAGDLSGDELRARPETARLMASVKEQMSGLSVRKVKIYNLAALTVFSTEPRQMGALKSDNLGYLSAAQGRVISELSFRDSFYSLEGIVSDRNLVSSYVPIRTAGGEIEGVLEIYDDVTEALVSLEQLQMTVIGLIGLILTLVFGALSALVARGEALLASSVAGEALSTGPIGAGAQEPGRFSGSAA